jgi:hypothetical protein
MLSVDALLLAALAGGLWPVRSASTTLSHG